MSPGGDKRRADAQRLREAAKANEGKLPPDQIERQRRLAELQEEQAALEDRENPSSFTTAPARSLTDGRDSLTLPSPGTPISDAS